MLYVYVCQLSNKAGFNPYELANAAGIVVTQKQLDRWQSVGVAQLALMDAA